MLHWVSVGGEREISVCIIVHDWMGKDEIFARVQAIVKAAHPCM